MELINLNDGETDSVKMYEREWKHARGNSEGGCTIDGIIMY